MATQTNNYGLTKPAWDELVDVSVLNDNSDIIDAQMHANELNASQAVANIADAYDATATYQTGDYCTYGGKLYQANTDISTAEAFDVTHWDETTAAEHFSDGGGGGGGTLIQPIIYSDTEREIGVWRDGKPLYQRTYSVVFSSNYVDITIDTTHEIKVMDGGVDSDNFDNFIHLGYGTSSSDMCGAYEYELGKIRFQNFYYTSRPNGWLTLWYTKTTDTPGSGTWTPSGVPAVHYSTDEQIIGTWIDGSALYQRSFIYQNPGMNSTTDIAQLDSDVRVKEIRAFMENQDDGRVYLLPYTGESGHSTSVMVNSNNAIRIILYNDSWGSAYSPWVVTIQYTKSTS